MSSLETCAFETARLSVAGWRASGRDLPGILAEMLSPEVTRELPPPWREEVDADWIDARDAEATMLLVVAKSDERALGLFVAADVGEGELRIGYVLGEAAWGQGLATELLGGFVEWCRAAGRFSSIAGGVTRANPASRRVLEKQGFHVAEETASEQVLRLSLD